MVEPPYTIEWYLDEDGKDAVRDWIEGLTPYQRRTIGIAMFEILQHEGASVVESEFGTHLGQGLFEFRVRQGPDEIIKRSRRPEAARSLMDKLRATVAAETQRKSTAENVLLRVFFHAHGDRLILLLGGYDKGRDPSKKRQQSEIDAARMRLTEWKQSGRSAG